MRPSRAPLLAAAAALTLPVVAHAQLGLSLPTTTTTTSTVTSTVADPVGTVGGTIGTVTGTVGTATGTITGTVGQTVDQVLGGTLGTLPTATIDGLLGAAGLNGSNGSNGSTAMPNGTVVVDKRPPNTTVRVLDTNRRVGRTGTLRLQISSDEPSVVALAGTVVPGRAWHLRGRARRLHSRKAIRIPKVLLAYRKAGALRLTIRFSRRAQRNIRGSYNTSVRLTLVAADTARNQVTRKVNRLVRH